ncbi:MAG: transposase [Paludibacteraceae bacterium]|nr:transposase [Paludibacteraceae bacterium]
MNNYPTNLTDNQWQVIDKFLDVQERKSKYPLRNIVNAINYLLKTGCQWRMPYLNSMITPLIAI